MASDKDRAKNLESYAHSLRKQLDDCRAELGAANAYIDEMETVGNIFHKREVARLREALTKIANTDYRGNRSTESEIAYAALRGEE